MESSGLFYWMSPRKNSCDSPDFWVIPCSLVTVYGRSCILNNGPEYCIYPVGSNLTLRAVLALKILIAIYMLCVHSVSLISSPF